MSDLFRVSIKPDAFIRMITHVSRFGNEALEESVEVMGICIGKIDEAENLIDLTSILPLQHGMRVSTGFTKEDVELITQLNKDYQDKDMKIVGWYISRPGWGLDFTEITIQNHRFFQTEKNPRGFLIIFDHTQMDDEKDFGFKIYRLKDHKKSIEYQEVLYEIEIPASLSYFKWVQKFVEDSQKLTPIMIKELKEEPLKDLQEIPLSEEESIEVSIEDYSSQVEQVVGGFRNGLSKLNNMISETYDSQLNTWIGDITQGTLKGTEHIRSSLTELKNAVSDGLREVENYFNSTFTEISDLFKRDITEYINKRIEGQKELKNELSTTLEKITKESIQRIESKIKNSLNPLEENILNSLSKLENLATLNPSLTEKTTKLNSTVSDMDNDVEKLKKDIGDNLGNVTDTLGTQMNDKFEEISAELNPLKENYSEIRTLLEKLQKIITDFRNLT